MNIAIDITPLETGHSGRGVGIYTKNLIESLQKYEKHHSYHFFTGKQGVPQDADVVHYPYFDPFFFTLPFVKHQPTVVTVHDLIPLVFPAKFPTGIRGMVKWQMQKISLQGAQRVITDSESSKQDIARIAGIRKEKINVVYLAASALYGPILDVEFLSRVRKTYALPQAFLLYVGDVNWNKNIEGLLRAYALVHRQSKFAHVQLVLVGAAFLDEALSETKQINHLIHSLGIEEMVIRPGRVPDADLAVFYSLATAYIQPSYYEGFGFPVLEAMACGTPVVTSTASSLVEIAGPAIRINPHDPDSMAHGVITSLSYSLAERIKISKTGLAWAQKFTWRKVAHDTARVYDKVLR